MSFKKIFLLGFFFCSLTLPLSVVQASFAPEDLYQQIYQANQNNLTQQTLKNLNQQTGIPITDLEKVLAGEFTENFLNACQNALNLQTNNLTQKNLLECLNSIKTNYAFENKLVELNQRLNRNAENSEIWTDGDLTNSFFDIMVDFMQIEILLFGETTYTYPFHPSRQNSPSLPTNKNQSPDDSHSLITNSSLSPTNSQFLNNNNSQPTLNHQPLTTAYPLSTINSQLSPTNTKQQPHCQDPEQIIFSKPIWSNSISNQQPAINNNSSATTTNQQFTSTLPATNDTLLNTNNPFLGSNFTFPTTSNNNCSGNALFGGLLCLDTWECDTLFCLTVHLIPQTPTTRGGKATYVQEIINQGNSQLLHLKGYNLTVHKNSNERFMVSVNKFLSKMINLDVVSQGIPVKFKDTKSNQFDEDNGNSKNGEDTTLLQKLRTKLGKAENCLPEENGDLTCDVQTEATLNLRVGKQASQTEAWSQTNQDETEKKKLKQATRSEFLKSQKMKFTQGEWQNIRKQLNIMANYYASITEILLKLSTEGQTILEDIKKSCNSKK